MPSKRKNILRGSEAFVTLLVNSIEEAILTRLGWHLPLARHPELGSSGASLEQISCFSGFNCRGKLVEEIGRAGRKPFAIESEEAAYLRPLAEEEVQSV